MDMGTVFELVLQAIGGAVLGPLLSAIVGGKGFGFIGNAIAGIVGGIGAGQGLDAIGMSDTLRALMGGGDIGGTLSELLKGGIGGGIIGILFGMIRR